MRIKRNGFTMIELLVVISLIGVLTILGLASYNASRQASRNARRSGDLKTIQGGLEQYFANNGSYPAGCNFGAQVATYFPQGFPRDPATGASYTPSPGSCTGTAYCYCIQYQPTTSTSGNSTVSNCSNYAAGSYFCVQNLQ